MAGDARRPEYSYPEWTTIPGCEMPKDTADKLLKEVRKFRRKTGLPNEPTKEAELVARIATSATEYGYKESRRLYEQDIKNAHKRRAGLKTLPPLTENPAEELNSVVAQLLKAFHAIGSLNRSAVAELECALLERARERNCNLDQLSRLKVRRKNERGFYEVENSVSRPYMSAGWQRYDKRCQHVFEMQPPIPALDGLRDLLMCVVDVVDPAQAIPVGSHEDGLIGRMTKGSRPAEPEKRILTDSFCLALRSYIGRVPTQSETRKALKIVFGEECAIKPNKAVERAYNDVWPSEIITYFEGKGITLRAITKEDKRRAIIREAYEEIYVIRPARQGKAQPLSKEQEEELYTIFWSD